MRATRTVLVAALWVAASLLFAGRTVQGVEIDGGTPASDIDPYLNRGNEKLPETNAATSSSASSAGEEPREVTRDLILANHERVGNLQDERLNGLENIASDHEKRISGIETRETVKVGGKTVTIVRRGNKVVRIIRLGTKGHHFLWKEAWDGGVVGQGQIRKWDAQTEKRANNYTDQQVGYVADDVSQLNRRVDGVSAVSWIALALGALAFGGLCVVALRRRWRPIY